jgi:hypothetical protein
MVTSNSGRCGEFSTFEALQSSVIVRLQSPSERIMIHVRQALRHLAGATAVTIALLGEPAAQPTQQAAPADLRAMLEGTWQLDEWHVDGQVLRPPQVDGRWSNHDGVVLVVYSRRDAGEAVAGYGTYRITADTWSYGYTRRHTSAARPGAAATVTTTEPGGELQAFKIIRTPGKVVLEGAANDRREYDQTFFTFMQNGRIVRKWRRITP